MGGVVEKPSTKHFKNCNLRPHQCQSAIIRLTPPHGKSLNWLASFEPRNPKPHERLERCKGPEEYVFWLWLWLFLGFDTHLSFPQLQRLLFSIQSSFVFSSGPWSMVLGPWSLFLGPFTPSSPSGFPTHLRPGPFHHLLRHRPHMGWQGGQFSIRVLKTFLRAIRCGLRFAVQIARIKFHFNLTNCCQQSRSLLSWWIRSDMTGGLMDSWRYAWDWDANGSIWAYS